MGPDSRQDVRLFLIALLCVYVAKQVVHVVAFPPFTGHDEVAHFAYLRTLVTELRIPVLGADTLPADLSPYARYALDWDGHTPAAQYLANHPPLYYVLMAPVYAASAGASAIGQMFAIRVAAIPFGLLTVVLSYRLATTLFPGDRFLAITVPTVVAFQPQVSYEAAMVNNDILAIALYSWILLLVVQGARDGFPDRTCITCGIALGLALLAKGTGVTAVPVVGVALLIAGARQSGRRFWRHGWLRKATLVAAPALVLASPWYAFLYATYGNFSAFPQIIALQSGWNLPEGGFFDLLFSVEFATMRFRETWGEFGWRLLPLGSNLLLLIGIAMLVGTVGLFQYVLRLRVSPGTVAGDPVLAPREWQALSLMLLVLTCVVSYLAVVQFGTRFVLTQARYYFPAVNAAALLWAIGVRTLVPLRYHPPVQGAVFVTAFLLSVAVLTQYVVPFYHSW